MKLLIASIFVIFSIAAGSNMPVQRAESSDKMVVQSTNQTTFILLRHAEKAAEGNNPELSADGLDRANALRFTLENVNIAAIYATPYHRTRQTAQPISEAKNIPVTEYNANTLPSRLIDEILTAHRGKTVVIVGHSNTIPAIIKTLNGNAKITIDESQYDNLYIVTHIQDSQANIVQLKYGKPTK